MILSSDRAPFPRRNNRRYWFCHRRCRGGWLHLFCAGLPRPERFFLRRRDPGELYFLCQRYLPLQNLQSGTESVYRLCCSFRLSSGGCVFDNALRFAQPVRAAQPQPFDVFLKPSSINKNTRTGKPLFGKIRSGIVVGRWSRRICLGKRRRLQIFLHFIADFSGGFYWTLRAGRKALSHILWIGQGVYCISVFELWGVGFDDVSRAKEKLTAVSILREALRDYRLWKGSAV